jgi:hypothetical protein
MASENALLVGWNRPLPGREGAATETFASFTNYLAKQQQMGNIESYEPVLLDAHGGDLNGFILIRASRPALDKLRATNEFVDQTTRANYLVDRFGIIDAYLGPQLQDRMARFQKLSTTVK